VLCLLFSLLLFSCLLFSCLILFFILLALVFVLVCLCMYWKKLLHKMISGLTVAITLLDITPASQPSTLPCTSNLLPLSPSLFHSLFLTLFYSLNSPHPLSLSPSLSHQVVYEWAKGTSFGKITEMTLTAEVQWETRCLLFTAHCLLIIAAELRAIAISMILMLLLLL
jgi:hypothetical protein